MTKALKRSARAAALSSFLTAVVLVTLAGPVQAAPAAQTVAPCWKLLITDWYDGTIDKTYPIRCYQQAVDHLPTDAQLYSSAKDDILRAMGRAIQAQNEVTTPATTATPTETEPETTPVDTTPTTTVEEEPTTTSEEVVPPATTTNPGRTQPEGVAGALDKLNPGDADSFPLPLIILGALAIALVAAGVAGMIWRRMDRGDADADPGAGPA